jgi:site-specific DNA-methyltransferase (adenine-specific)
MTVDLRLGNCFHEFTLIPSSSIPCIITDIPYNQVNRATGGLRQIDKGLADAAPVDVAALAKELARITSGSIYVWCATEQVSLLRDCLVKAGLTTRLCIWHKSNPSPANGQHLWLTGLELCIFARKSKATFNRFCANPIWKGPSERVKDFPCPKPVWLMKELIEASTNPGDLVADFYMGSGSTGVAAVSLGRNFLGTEIDPASFQIAQDRIAQAQLEMKTQP